MTGAPDTLGFVSSDTSTTPRGSVVFAGGGTGGHIFPALAIAQALIETASDHQPIRRLMVGSDKPLDQTLRNQAVEAGTLESTIDIPARPFGIRPKAAFRLITTWGTCVRETRMLLRDERDRTGRPPVVVAMGGYVSAAPAQAAVAEGCPLLLVNLDAIPGKANRWVASRADARLCVGTRNDLFEPLESTPINPIVRTELRARRDPAEARISLGLDPDRPTLLITGGSQGARTINTFLVAFAQDHAEGLRRTGWQILHQSGPDDEVIIAERYNALGIPALVVPRIDAMGDAWDAADVSVCRAGAGTVAEAWATATPSFFMPYPFHRDMHQRANAAVLTDRGAGVLGDDRIETDANTAHNTDSLLELLTNEDRRARIRDMLSSLGPANGADTVAKGILSRLG